MTSRRARASVLLLWLVACGGGGKPDPCAIPADGDGFLLYAADGDPDPLALNLELRAIKIDGSCDQPVASGPDYDLFPSWSRSTGLVAWGAGRGGQNRIVIQSVQGGPQRVLDTGPELATAPSLSQDGTLVAYERLAAGGSTADVYLVPVAGGAPVELAAGSICVPDPASTTIPPACLGGCLANDAGPAFSSSAEGRFLYFVSSRSSTSCAAGAQVNEVWRQAIDVTGAAVGLPEQVTTGSGIVGRPAISPDGRSLAYARGSDLVTSFSKVVLHDLASHQERTITDQSDSEPAFAPGGDALAVRTTRFGVQGDLVVVDLATGAVRKRLTPGGLAVGSPAFPR